MALANGVQGPGRRSRRTRLALVLHSIPEGAEVHGGLSETLRALGISQEIEESGRFESVRARLGTLDRATQGREMRKLGGAPDYMVGSADAVTDDGQIVVGSGSGSQLGAYATPEVR